MNSGCGGEGRGGNGLKHWHDLGQLSLDDEGFERFTQM